MADDVYAMVDNVQRCAKQGATMKHQLHLLPFPVSVPLYFIAVDFLGSLLRTRMGSQYFIIITDFYTKLTRAIHISKAWTLYVEIILFDKLLVPYGIPSFLSTENGPQFVGKLFENLCLDLNVEYLTTTTYHPQKTGQV